MKIVKWALISFSATLCLVYLMYSKISSGYEDNARKTVIEIYSEVESFKYANAAKKFEGSD
ncbi:hypothetical protein R50073_36800 [Maricurvus nonylphenolicus]|uniref:hypothetical protein n=1 Tax=Maricurvus nonylphenolicus TaxID=1008307 RepID=UPI0036F3C897